ncbi:hypothetical protein PIB30_109086, partial [Stylosanthes scabra]|nr:hypothetical protein [Stylosanthes scabra]
MQNIKPGNTKGLPYAILWTAIFKYLGIDLSQARKKKLGYNHCIDTHVLNLMKKGEIPQQGDQEDNQEQAQAQAQEEEQAMDEEPTLPQAGPSMQDMMEVLLRIEQNQTSMGSRLDKIEHNQARMLRKIRRVEAWTFGEDEAEDDDDDF